MSRVVGVLVVFCPVSGEREAVALQTAVGAVEARGRIRLRCLGSHEAVEAETNAPLGRIEREYIAPNPSDIEWADAVVLCAPDASLPWQRFGVMLSEACSAHNPDGKVGVVLAGPGIFGESADPVGPWLEELFELGLVLVPATGPNGLQEDGAGGARLAGRRAVLAARALTAPGSLQSARTLL